MNIFIPITKVDVEKRLVYGTLSEETPDKSGEILDYESAKPAFQKWSDEQSAASNGKSLGNVRAMHGSIAAGKLTDISYDDENKRVEGCAKIIDDAEWQKVLEGVYTGFSIGGGYAKRWADPQDPSGTMRYTPTLAEVSIVDNPCHPAATFSVIKKDGSVELRKFNQPKPNEDKMTTQSLVKDGKAVKPVNAPLQKWIANDGSPFDSKREAEIRNLEIEALAAFPGLAKADDMLNRVKITEHDEHPVEDHLMEETYAEGDSEETKKAKDAKKEKRLAQEKEDEAKKDMEMKEKAAKDMEMAAKDKMKEKEEADKKKADTKADKPKEGDEDEGIEEEEDEEDKDEEDDKAKGKAGEKAKKSIDSLSLFKKKEKAKKAEKEGKEEYGDVEYADEGHQEDKKKRYPIDTEEHIRAAWNYINKEKNEAKYDAEDLKSVKDKIIAAWKKEIDKDGPPSAKDKKAMKSLRAQVLAKGMDTVAHFAHKLEHISMMVDACEMEADREGDESDLPMKLKGWLAAGIPIFLDMCEEETEELLEGDDDDVNYYCMEVPMCMSATLPAGAFETLAKSIEEDFEAKTLAKSDSKVKSARGASLLKFASELKKAGARHSAADMEKIEGLHKAAEELHECMGKAMEDHMDKVTDLCKGLGFEAPESTEEDKGPAAQKMSKLIDTLNTALAKEAARDRVEVKINEALEKSSATIEKLLNRLEKQDARIEHLEGQPAPTKGNVRSFSKSDDGLSTAKKVNPQAVNEALEKMTPQERANVLMKAALKNPMAASDMSNRR